MSVELSVAIIFKNEIRCLERCLKSLQPLRERFSCEIVMADTGSTDGSREIAERYADIVFDFPWINDFAAARNAVLDRCSGRWALALDCDEWLDETAPAALEGFLHGKVEKKLHCAQVHFIDYATKEFDRYAESFLLRLLNMGTKPRYEGAIHEFPQWKDTDVKSTFLHDVTLYHDGYVMLNDGSEEGRKKLKRNLEILRGEAEKDPDNLSRLYQLIESSAQEPNLPDILRGAVDKVRQKKNGWDKAGPPIVSCAVSTAYEQFMPELVEWAAMAQSMFPDSFFTRIDVNYTMMRYAAEQERWEDAAACGREYLKARRDARNNARRDLESTFGVIKRDAPYWEADIRLRTAAVYDEQGKLRLAEDLLSKVEWPLLSEEQIRRFLNALKQTTLAGYDGSAQLCAFWDGICEEKPDRSRAEERKRVFTALAETFFKEKDEAWKLFLPLRGRCAVGDAAALLACEEVDEGDTILSETENLAALPAKALIHAIRLGCAFPVPGRSLNIEDAEMLALHMRDDLPFLREMAVFASLDAEDAQDVLWAHALAYALIQNSEEWVTDDDAFLLICAFVRAESAFIGRFYAEEAVRNPEYLQPIHRFALYLANAFSVIAPSAVAPDFKPIWREGVRGALDQLRAAVEIAPEQKAMIDRILDEISGAGGSRR